MSWTAYAITACAVIIATALLVFLQGSKPLPLEPTRKSGRVSYVIDGDTLILSASEGRLRLWGIDAPEKDQQGAQRATMALKSLVEGKHITWIEIDVDRYGRSVARVFLPDGREINHLMIKNGTAREYCRYSKGFYGRC
ncbi:hypothetical protein So717_43180 [Roseobacter cerasinus]|uniref:TNase-like domain-containing protein n=1 Tax=Roseobacter cerasinus TaxID=2602289 RepID=A0A640W054_9RHOB|nr:thermonuclease family protein [Roseobacter cerasinus]GFE52565.1 hypothetical protein So717_43180 [Roseobacter cerasinus]